MNDFYYQKYIKYKSKYLIYKNIQCGGKKQYKCGRYSYNINPNSVCDNKGGIEPIKDFYGWNLLDHIKCSNPKYFNKQKKTFDISNSKTVIVSDIHNIKIQREGDVKNVKPGDYNLFVYKNQEDNDNNFYVAMHTKYDKKDIKNLQWICKGTFNTDVANGGLYDKKYYDDPTELKNVEQYKPDPDFNCDEKKNKWNECKKLTIALNQIVILPHGFYVGTCGDGGFRYWIAKNDKKEIVAFGFRHC